MSGQDLYCICNGPYHSSQFMIQCDVCKDWFHGRCVGIKENEASRIDTYHCPKCADLFGPLTLKPQRVSHRQDYAEVNDGEKAIRNGNVSFVKQLDDRHFHCGDDILLHLSGKDLNKNFLEKEGFNYPILIRNKSHLGLMLPTTTFTVADVEKYVGSMRDLDVIDVARQEDISMKMREWTEYYNSSDRKRILNVISLEFSDTELSNLVEAPDVVRHIDLLHYVWPNFSSESWPLNKPQVKKYCLMSVKASYTDFHIDFGGSSVWYHVFKGEKIFYLIEPTPENLSTYEQWVSSKLQNEVFLGDLVHCYKCHIKEGETLFIPTGWIHAVYTPVDSLVFGGNFLHFLNMELQLQIYNLEIRLNTPEKFLFPFFETCIWYAGRYLQDLGREKIEACSHLQAAVVAITRQLQTWCLKDNIKVHKRFIPTCIHYKQLLKNLKVLKEKHETNATDLKHAKTNGEINNAMCFVSPSKSVWKSENQRHVCENASSKRIRLKFSCNQQNSDTKISVPPITLSLKTTAIADVRNKMTITTETDLHGNDEKNSSAYQSYHPDHDRDGHCTTVERVYNCKRKKVDFEQNGSNENGEIRVKLHQSLSENRDLNKQAEANLEIINPEQETSKFRAPNKTAKQRLGKLLKIDKTGRYLW